MDSIIIYPDETHSIIKTDLSIYHPNHYVNRMRVMRNIETYIYNDIEYVIFCFQCGETLNYFDLQSCVAYDEILIVGYDVEKNQTNINYEEFIIGYHQEEDLDDTIIEDELELEVEDDNYDLDDSFIASEDDFDDTEFRNGQWLERLIRNGEIFGG